MLALIDFDALRVAFEVTVLVMAAGVAVLLYLGKLFDVTEGMSGE